MLSMLTSTWHVLLMLLGFGLVIVIHELGHFVAAKWAGIRVHAFAVGFGQAICSWRKGMGFRMGSSESDYLRSLRRAHGDDAPSDPALLRPDALSGVSSTEYRLNWFPFGGYVKMLGQEDLNPDAATTAPDSYTSQPVWKRMIVISGGVVMNIILAAVLFVIAFTVGLSETPPVIGFVAPDSPARAAGLQPGDTVLSINGKPARTFNDIFLSSAMAGPEEVLDLEVARPGTAKPLHLNIKPTLGGDFGLMHIGVGMAYGDEVPDDFATDDARERTEHMLESLGLSGVEPGMTLVNVGGGAIGPGAPGTTRFSSWSQALERALHTSDSTPVPATFRAPDGREVTVSIAPQPDLQFAKRSGDAPATLTHIAGLTPVMQVMDVTPASSEQGIARGDVLARVGDIEWPDTATGRAEIARHKGKTLPITVLRSGERLSLDVRVTRKGTVGFYIESGTRALPFVRSLPDDFVADTDNPDHHPATARLIPGLIPGSRIVRIDDAPIQTFGDVAIALRQAAQQGRQSVALELESPIPGASAHETLTLELDANDTAALAALGWNGEEVLAQFGLSKFLDRASGPLEAVSLGVRKTNYVVAMTYLTFVRLAQGTMPVKQLQGPVGITHIGSRIAGRGLIYLVFFLGLISANLAVINFLPLPVVDGGHFVFLLVEGITRRPVSIAIQNVATLAGLVLIGAVFILVTFNDIARLVG